MTLGTESSPPSPARSVLPCSIYPALVRGLGLQAKEGKELRPCESINPLLPRHFDISIAPPMHISRTKLQPDHG